MKDLVSIDRQMQPARSVQRKGYIRVDGTLICTEIVPLQQTGLRVLGIIGSRGSLRLTRDNERILCSMLGMLCDGCIGNCTCSPCKDAVPRVGAVVRFPCRFRAGSLF